MAATSIIQHFEEDVPFDYEYVSQRELVFDGQTPPGIEWCVVVVSDAKWHEARDVLAVDLGGHECLDCTFPLKRYHCHFVDEESELELMVFLLAETELAALKRPRDDRGSLRPPSVVVY